MRCTFRTIWQYRCLLAVRSFSGSARYLARREVRFFQALLDSFHVERPVSFQALLDSFHVERPVSFQALLDSFHVERPVSFQALLCSVVSSFEVFCSSFGFILFLT